MPVNAPQALRQAMRSGMKFLERLTLARKLRYGIGALLGIIFLLSAAAIYSARQQAEQLRDMYTLKLVGLSIAKESHTHLMEVGRNLRQMLLARNASERDVAQRELDHVRQELLSNLEDSKTRFRSEQGQRLRGGCLVVADATFGLFVLDVHVLVHAVQAVAVVRGTDAAELLLDVLLTLVAYEVLHGGPFRHPPPALLDV